MSIPVERYADPEGLEEEIEKIFWRRCFVAHESELSSHNDYFSFRLGRRCLTLRRFDDDLALLENVCRHRFNLIDPLGFGSRPFRCAYHGWTYDRAGQIVFIPFREQFSNTPSPLLTHLKQAVDGFVFKIDRVADEAEGEFRLLSQVGSPLGPSFHRSAITHRCNWKLMVENVLESYHVSVVHPNTFAKSGFTSSSESQAVEAGTDSMLTLHAHPRVRKHLAQLFPGANGTYVHVYVFPNLFVSVTNDLIYFVSSVLPVSATESVLYYRLFGTQRFASLAPSVQQHLREEAIRFTETTLSEDKEILEHCQIGMQGATGEYVLSSKEARIERFHQTYLAYL